MKDVLYLKGLAFVIVSLFFCMIFSHLSHTVTADSSNILYVGGAGSDNYSSIQDAIDDAVDGDTVFVHEASSPYIEKLIIDKSINLIGENKDTTIIDADGNGDAVKIIADGVQFCNFTVQNTGIGNSPDVLENSAIEIISSDNHIIKNVICLDTNYGIWTDYSDNNIIMDNVFYAYYDGISLDESKNNILRNNTMFGSGLVLGGSSVELLTHDIDTSNTANGKPVYYYLNKESIMAPNDAGQVILVNCSNCTIADLEISKVTDGIELLFSNNNIVMNNTLFGTTDFGIRLGNSNHNIIKNNKMTNCFFGVGFSIAGLEGLKRNADCKHNRIINNSFESNNLGIIIEMSNYNQICNNNFIASKFEHVHFVCSYKNYWNNNYWD